MLDRTKGNAMQHAFAKVGLKPEIVELDLAIAKVLNHGGTIDDVQARVNLARLKLSGGAVDGKPQGQFGIAPSRQPESSGEANDAVPQGQAIGADPLPLIASEGHGAISDLASKAVTPAREPTPTQTAAVAAVAKAAALSVFERELTSWGKQWGNVFYRDLDGMREDGAIADAVKAHIGHLRGEDRHKTIRDLMTVREFTLLLNRVRKGNRHAA